MNGPRLPEQLQLVFASASEASTSTVVREDAEPVMAKCDPERPAVTNLIREGKIRQLRNIVATGTREGMQVLEQHLGQLIAAGVITMEEAMAVSVHAEDIAGYHTQATTGVPVA